MIEDIDRTPRATADKLYVRQAGILTIFRDTLLPRLIFAHFRLAEADAFAEEAIS